MTQHTSRWRAFWAIAWPVSLQTVLVNILGMVDIMMVGQLSSQSIAAVGFGSKIIFVAMVILSGAASTMGILAAQHWGTRNQTAFSNTTALGCTISLVVSLTQWAIITIAAPEIMGIATQNPDIIELGARYLRLCAPMLIATALMITLETALRSIGETRLPLIVGGLSILINIALNQVFIFGIGQWEGMGVGGAAIATSIARTIQAGILFWVIGRRMAWVIPTIQTFKHALEADSIKHYLRLAVPVTANFMVWAFGNLAYSVLYARLGADQMTLHSIIIPIENTLNAIFMGMGTAASVLICHRLGANQFDKAWQDAKLFIGAAFVVPLVIGLSSTLAIPVFLSAMLPADSHLVQDARSLLLLALSVNWMRTLNMVMIIGVLRSGGDNRFCLFADTLAQWGVGITLTTLAVVLTNWSLFFIYLISCSEELVRGALCLSRIRKKKWLNNLTTTNTNKITA